MKNNFLIFSEGGLLGFNEAGQAIACATIGIRF